MYRAGVTRTALVAAALPKRVFWAFGMATQHLKDEVPIECVLYVQLSLLLVLPWIQLILAARTQSTHVKRA